MPKIIHITDFSDPALDVYSRLTGAQLRNKLEPEAGIFIAESPTVIEVAMQGGCEPVSILTDERLLQSGGVAAIIEKCTDVPIYTAGRELLTQMTGFELTRGALCAMKRPALPSLDEVLSGARRIAVLEEVTDSTNIGAIFRSAAALGIDAVLVTPTCCDPLCRRAVRVSMGTVFLVPWTRIGEISFAPKSFLQYPSNLNAVIVKWMVNYISNKIAIVVNSINQGFFRQSSGCQKFFRFFPSKNWLNISHNVFIRQQLMH